MTEISRDDLRAAVSAGLMTEAQAAQVMVLADERAGVRAQRSGLDEPFELFKGFNEIFIVVGLSILYLGYSGIAGFGILTSGRGYILGLIFSIGAMAGIYALGRYFTLTRRMVAPSIALAIMFAFSTMQLASSLGAWFRFDFPATLTFAAAMVGVTGCFYYAFFRVPFSMMIIGLSVVATVFGVAILNGAQASDPSDLFLLTADGPFAVLTILLGLIGAGIALSFDMSDPHRVTRRSGSAFWLHVLSAPAIVNTVALTLFLQSSVAANATLLLFLGLMALFAIVIDRRSFLVSGVGYVVALSIAGVEGEGAFLVILILGVGLVLLGAQWERLRSAIMRALPGFPGKTRLPPYVHKERTP